MGTISGKSGEESEYRSSTMSSRQQIRDFASHRTNTTAISYLADQRALLPDCLALESGDACENAATRDKLGEAVEVALFLMHCTHSLPSLRHLGRMFEMFVS